MVLTHVASKLVMLLVGGFSSSPWGLSTGLLEHPHSMVTGFPSEQAIQETKIGVAMPYKAKP